MSNKLKEKCIKITDKGAKLNREMTLSEVTNLTVSALLSIYVSQTNEDNRKDLYNMLALAFSNTLAVYAPELYFPTAEELAEDEEALSRLAEGLPDISDKIEEMKRTAQEHMSDSYTANETAYFDESGRAYFKAEEDSNATN